MVTDQRTALENEALRRQRGSHMLAAEGIDANEMGAESAGYIEPTIDPQWIDGWKMFLDRDGNESGIPCKLPRGQWDQGGPNALMNLRRPDGGFWFTLATPTRVQPEFKYECFVGMCQKKVPTRSKLVGHVEVFHYEEAQIYAVILNRIKAQVASEDPRLQRLLAELDQPADEFVAVDDLDVLVLCPSCGASAPPEHADPEAWLRGHKLGAHKVEQPA